VLVTPHPPRPDFFRFCRAADTKADVTPDAWTTSASQVSLYDVHSGGCARKWVFRYLLGLKTPQHPAAALGEDVDTGQLQPYLRDGRPFDFTRPSGEIAASGLAFLPKPKTNSLEVQKHFVIPSPTLIEGEPVGIQFQGYIDLWLPRGMTGDAETPLVIDFKTTSDLKWAKSEEDLKTDTQAQLYAFAAAYLTRKRTVDLTWIYLQTRGARKAKRVHLQVTADQAAEQFARINDVALEMKTARDANPSPLELPPNPDACESYGGCPYRDRCNLSPAQVIAAVAAKEERKESMSNTAAFLAAMRAKKSGGQAAPAVVPAAVPAPAPAPAIEVVGINPPESTLPPPAPAPPAPAPVEAKRRGRPAKPAPTAPAVEQLGITTAETAPAPAAPDEDHVPSPEAVLACIRTLVRYARSVK
jgi:hypothetical protein